MTVTGLLSVREGGNLLTKVSRLFLLCRINVCSTARVRKTGNPRPNRVAGRERERETKESKKLGCLIAPSPIPIRSPFPEKGPFFLFSFLRCFRKFLLLRELREHTTRETGFHTCLSLLLPPAPTTAHTPVLPADARLPFPFLPFSCRSVSPFTHPTHHSSSWRKPVTSFFLTRSSQYGLEAAFLESRSCGLFALLLLLLLLLALLVHFALLLLTPLICLHSHVTDCSNHTPPLPARLYSVNSLHAQTGK
jgi:hypothetical protein